MVDWNYRIYLDVKFNLEKVFDLCVLYFLNKIFMFIYVIWSWVLDYLIEM